MSLSLHRQVVVAFAQQIAAGLGVAIEQNALDPATVTPGIEKVLVQGDGAEPPRYQDVEGIKIYGARVRVLGFVGVRGNEDPFAPLDDLWARILTAIYADPTLDGLLYGRWSGNQDTPHFDGLTEGECDAWRFENTANPGATFEQAWLLEYAVEMADPRTLVRGDAALRAA